MTSRNRVYRMIMYVLAIALSFMSTAHAQGAMPAITFSPVNPTSKDLTVAYLNVQNPYCFFGRVFASSATTISIVSDIQLVPCVETRQFAPLGVLPAGTYQVSWFYGPPEPATATLVVTNAALSVTPVPALSALVVVVLVCMICILGASRIRRVALRHLRQ